MNGLDRERAEAAIDEYDRKFDTIEAASLHPGHPGEWMRDLLDTLETCVTTPGTTFTHREAQTLLGWYADAYRGDEQPSDHDRALAERLGDVL